MTNANPRQAELVKNKNWESQRSPDTDDVYSVIT